MPESITVSALNKYVHSLLESDPVLSDIAIQGEISNFNVHYKSGHCYFSLKDDKASVRAVMFRSDAARLAFQPESGMSVIARCRVSLYERDGAFQLYVTDLFPDGVGAAQMAFEQLKKRLNAEGLFLEEYKKLPPAYPKYVGLVTSRNGAALQDILKVARYRCPAAHFLLAPVTVQGMQAAEEIANAITLLDRNEKVDTIIVARGGGSAEDLWVFNAEVIARAAFACQTPVVSAIGHEIDFTILDFVADLRAPTPSAAAEMVLPDLPAAHVKMLDIYKNIANNIHYKFKTWYNNIDHIMQSPQLAAVRETPQQKNHKLKSITETLVQTHQKAMKLSSGRLAAAVQLAASLNPYAVLARGYGIVRWQEQPIHSVKDVAEGQTVDVEMQDGKLACTVNHIKTTKERG